MTRILVVDDDPAMGRLVSEGLTGEGYEVTLVSNGVDALIAVANQQFNAAAIDVMLPEMSGFEICRHLRSQGSTLPVLLLTARDAIEDRVRGLDAGADDYLTKPFAFAEFSARIRALVRREVGAVRSTIRLADLELDTATVRATVRGRPVAMSLKEFALLRFFAAHVGEPVTREEILAEVWGTVLHIDRNVVDQYVRYLRKKLDPLAAGVRIDTIRGTGYVLEVDAP